MTKVLALTALFLLGAQVRADAIPILDTLGTATPATQFSSFGTGGTSILPTQFLGPQFVLGSRTLITEIGGFVNNATGSTPLTVQVRPATHGAPDPTTVLTSLLLSHDGDPFALSYESAATHLSLGPGRYFALFAPQDGSQGVLLASASGPFDYLAGLATFGCLGASCGTQTVFDGFGAVRILGRPVPSVPEPSTLVLLSNGLAAVILVRQRANKKSIVAIRPLNRPSEDA